MSISAYWNSSIRNYFPEEVASKVFLGLLTFVAVDGIDRSLRCYFSSKDEVKSQALPLGTGIAHALVEQLGYSVILRTSNESRNFLVNLSLKVARFCLSLLLGATGARSLGVSSLARDREFSSDIIKGFYFAVFREGALFILPQMLSLPLLILGDGVVAGLAEACSKAGESPLSNMDWYYRAFSRGIFQMVLGCTTLSGSTIPAFISHALFNVSCFIR